MTKPPLPRRLLTVLEPIAGGVYLSQEGFEEYAAIGLTDGWSGYFCSRSAAMGAVSAEVVAAAFYNFNPELVRQSIRWDLASPEVVYEARLRAVARVLTRGLADPDGEGRMEVPPRAIELLKEAVAACPPHGRPLAAPHAALPWPEDDLLGLWHGANVLREFRGDGHNAVLLQHGVGPVDAILLHSAYMSARPDFFLQTRQWDEATVAAARERLTARNFLTPDGLSEGGAKFRLMLEHETDRAAEPPIAALGPGRSEELIALLQPVAMRILEQKAAPRAMGRMDPSNKLV